MTATQRNRLRLRLSLLIMIVATLTGALLTLSTIRRGIAELQAQSQADVAAQEFDWVEFFSALGEQTIQVFIGVTSETP